MSRRTNASSRARHRAGLTGDLPARPRSIGRDAVVARPTAGRVKAHKDRLPGMVYADRLTANTRAWDNHETRRDESRARYLDAVGIDLGTPKHTLAQVH